MKKLVLMLLTVLLLAGCSSPQTPLHSAEGEQQALHKQTESLESMEHTDAMETEKPQSETTRQTEQTETAEPTGSKPTESTEPPTTQPPHEHQYTESTVAATCTAQGYTLHSCSCGDSYRDNPTPALGHDYTDTVIAPTTDTQGYTRHTCTRCGDSYDDTYVDKLKVIYDINRAMEVGNAYALSIGFAAIDYSFTPWNAGYYPNEVLYGFTITALGGQAWLEQCVRDGAQGIMQMLDAARGENAHTTCAYRCYISYDPESDAYTIYELYA